MLGTEANVRLLRALVATDTPLAASELARRARLQLSGAGKALSALEATGVVELVGTGRRRPARLRPDHPLADALHALFRAEQGRFDALVGRLRDAARRLTPIPSAAWIEGPVARAEDGADDPLVVAILGPARDLGRARDALEDALGEVEREFDVTIEVRGRTTADLEAAAPGELEELREAIPLLGPPPLSLLPGAGRRPTVAASRRRSHADADAQALALAAAVAERLRTDPSLVTRARTQLAARLAQASPGERRELREWDRILRTMPVPRLRRFLVDSGERATRLRQSLPFAGLLTAAERERIAASPAASPVARPAAAARRR